MREVNSLASVLSLVPASSFDVATLIGLETEEVEEVVGSMDPDMRQGEPVGAKDE